MNSLIDLQTRNAPRQGFAGCEGVIDGVVRVELHRVRDRRGDLTTVHIGQAGVAGPAQWNLVRSGPRVIRGIHVHSRYDEYYAPAAGPTWIYLRDVRAESPTYGAAICFWAADDEPAGFKVPAGVAHGLAFPEGGVLLYALSAVWTGDDEFGCRWNDPDLGVAWPIADPVLSDRDATACGYREMLAQLARARTRPPAP